MDVRHAHTPRNSGNLGVVPFNRESEWSAPEYAEVICVVGVFPDILTGEHQISSQSLLQTNVEFVAPAGAKRSDCACGTDQKRIQDRIGASRAGKYQVLVERSFQYSRI